MRWSALRERLAAAGRSAREWFAEPDERLREWGVGEGDTVLDFGCGEGAYALVAAARVGPEGVVYAVDRDPDALGTVTRRARERGLRNLRTVRSTGFTGLRDGSVDVAMLHEVVHLLDDPGDVLAELRRALRPDGVLLVTTREGDVEADLARVRRAGHFRLEGEPGRRTRWIRRG